MDFDLPKDQSSIIKVIGVGGGGSNAVNHMYNQGIKGVDFIICNTDQQALDLSPVPMKMQLGTTLTEGRGAGSNPEVGKNAAIESIDELKEILAKQAKMVFITAGMGGGTGTGAAPVLAQAAKEMGILTVGIVTVPFLFEGRRRKQQADFGLAEMRKNVDTLLVICNDKLREMHGNLKLSEAFAKADDVLTVAAKGIAEIITVAGYVNVDFEDVRTVMKDGGTAIMGSAQAEGENRALKAVTQALASPLLDDNDITGADYILLNITSGEEEVSMDEIDEITEHIQNETGNTAEIIWGNGRDETLGSKISVTIIATGFGRKAKRIKQVEENKIVHNLEDEVETNITTHLEENERKVEKPVDEPTLKLNTNDFISQKEEIREENIEENPNVLRFTLDDENTEDEEDKNKETTLFELNNTPQKTSFTKRQPDENYQKSTQEKLSRLREVTLRMKTPKGLSELEMEPAYKRKDVRLEDVPPSSEPNISRYTLTENDEETKKAELKKNNSFLHDNVD